MDNFEFEDLKYGLIAVDRRDFEQNPDGDVSILHFCGYKSPVTQNEINEFFRELSTTPEFGVMDIMEFIDVFEAPESVVEEYRNGLINGNITENE